MRGLLTAATFLALALAAVSRADEKKADDAKPADLPLKAKLIVKKATYKLDLDGKSADDFRKLLKDAEKAGKAPTPPAVDLVLEITNTSDSDIKFWTDGDANELQLEVKGPENGAVSIAPRRAFTADFRMPKVMTLAAGKTYSIPIKSLEYGFRGASKATYWTEPGDYTIKASFVTAISPAPKGTKEIEKGFGSAVISSKPMKVKVEAAK